MEIRAYCYECNKEIACIPSVSEGTIILEIIPHNCEAAQQSAQADGACEHVWQASPVVGVDAVCAICGVKSPRR